MVSRRIQKQLLALFLGLCLSLVAQAHTVAEIARADRLLELIERRLRVSEAVAQAKWNRKAPVEDLVREAEVMERFAEQAKAHGLEVSLARDFMRAQIEASKVRQRELLAEWRSRRRAHFAGAPDLREDIRPRLDLLNVQLLQALVAYQEVSHSSALLAWRARLLWGAEPGEARSRALEWLDREL